jgi:hypothetical protein
MIYDYIAVGICVFDALLGLEQPRPDPKATFLIQQSTLCRATWCEGTNTYNRCIGCGVDPTGARHRWYGHPIVSLPSRLPAGLGESPQVAWALSCDDRRDTHSCNRDACSRQRVLPLCMLKARLSWSPVSEASGPHFQGPSTSGRLVGEVEGLDLVAERVR